MFPKFHSDKRIKTILTIHLQMMNKQNKIDILDDLNSAGLKDPQSSVSTIVSTHGMSVEYYIYQFSACPNTQASWCMRVLKKLLYLYMIPSIAFCTKERINFPCSQPQHLFHCISPEAPNPVSVGTLFAGPANFTVAKSTTCTAIMRQRVHQLNRWSHCV